MAGIVPSLKEAVVIWLQALEGTGLRCTGPHVRETTRGHSKGVQRRCVKTELDSLATALYVKTDDLLKVSPQLAPWRPAAGIAPKLGDTELVTLAMMQAMLGFTSEARWLRPCTACLSPSP